MTELSNEKTTAMIPVATAEIVALHTEIVDSLRHNLTKAMRIGQLLAEAKANLQHGEFGPWCDSLPFTDRTARNYMRLWRERDRLKTENVSDLGTAYKLLGDSSAEKSPHDEGRTPYEWEPGPTPGEFRIGATSDRRLVVLRSIDARYIRTAVCDVDGGYWDYDTRGINRDYLAFALTRCHKIDIDDIFWSDPLEGDAEIVAAAFGEGIDA